MCDAGRELSERRKASLAHEFRSGGLKVAQSGGEVGTFTFKFSGQLVLFDLNVFGPVQPAIEGPHE